MEQLQEQIASHHSEKEVIEKDVNKKEEEIKQLEEQFSSLKVSYEKNELKLLTYRKDDILDLIKSIHNMGNKVGGFNASEIKKKIDMLDEEVVKINNELFELEKKYGEVKIIRKNDTIQVSSCGK
jgi:chromosome segregation ATPase